MAPCVTLSQQRHSAEGPGLSFTGRMAVGQQLRSITRRVMLGAGSRYDRTYNYCSYPRRLRNCSGVNHITQAACLDPIAGACLWTGACYVSSVACMSLRAELCGLSSPLSVGTLGPVVGLRILRHAIWSCGCVGRRVRPTRGPSLPPATSGCRLLHQHVCRPPATACFSLQELLQLSPRRPLSSSGCASGISEQRAVRRPILRTV